VLQHSQRPELIQQTLQTLHAFLSWIPLGYIFESTLLDTLLKLSPVPEFRNVALQCLGEIGGLAVEQKYDAHFVKLYVTVITQLQQILPRSVKIAEAYANGGDDEQAYIQTSRIFLTQFFKHHVTLLEQTSENQQHLLIGFGVPAEHLVHGRAGGVQGVPGLLARAGVRLVPERRRRRGGGRRVFLRPRPAAAAAARGACCTRARCRSSGF
jgi:hypothetical protein